MIKRLAAALAAATSLLAVAAAPSPETADAAHVKSDYVAKRAKCNELSGKERKDCLFDARVKYKAPCAGATGEKPHSSEAAHDANEAAAAEASHVH